MMEILTSSSTLGWARMSILWITFLLIVRIASGRFCVWLTVYGSRLVDRGPSVMVNARTSRDRRGSLFGLVGTLVSFLLVCGTNAQSIPDAGHAADGEERAVAAWIRSLGALSDPLTLPSNTKWTVTAALQPPSPETLGQWRSAVQGHPEHPLRAVLAAQEEVANHPERRLRVVLFVSDAGTWRIINDEPFTPGVEYLDQGSGHGTLWSLSKQSMSLRDSTPEATGKTAAEALDMLTCMYSQGVSLMGNLPDDASIHINAIGTAIVTYPNGSYAELKYTNHAGDKRVISLRTFGKDSPDPFVDYQPREYHFESELGHLVATLARRKRGDEVLDLRLEEAEKVTRTEVETVSRVPDPTGSDTLRGRLEVRSVNDLRQNRLSLSTLSGGQWSTRQFPTPETSDSRVRTIGWGAAGLIVAVLVFLRIRSTRSR